MSCLVLHPFGAVVPIGGVLALAVQGGQRHPVLGKSKGLADPVKIDDAKPPAQPRQSGGLTGMLARVELAPEVLDDVDRMFELWGQFAVENAPARIAGIVPAIGVVSPGPPIGRPARGGKRELVIGRAARRLVALHRIVPRIGTVSALAIRNQREAGYGHDGCFPHTPPRAFIKDAPAPIAAVPLQE